MTQLRVIEHALKATLPSTAPAHMVIFGDLNFRYRLYLYTCIIVLDEVYFAFAVCLAHV